METSKAVQMVKIENGCLGWHFTIIVKERPTGGDRLITHYEYHHRHIFFLGDRQFPPVKADASKLDISLSVNLIRGSVVPASRWYPMVNELHMGSAKERQKMG